MVRGGIKERKVEEGTKGEEKGKGELRKVGWEQEKKKTEK